MTQIDLDYFEQRHRQELSMATCAEDNVAAMTHFKLADAYASKVREITKRSLADEQRDAFEASTRPSVSSPMFPLLRN